VEVRKCLIELPEPRIQKTVSEVSVCLSVAISLLAQKFKTPSQELCSCAVLFSVHTDNA
jgi:hypothetical protein